MSLYVAIGTSNDESVLERFQSAGAVNRLSPVRSLDQIYAQAAGLDDVLKGKVQQWALKSRGQFRVKHGGDEAEGRGGFVLWEQAATDPQLCSRIQWGGLKSVKRSIEKLVRSYRHDVSRLVDVCRKSIVFEDVAGVCACLRAMREDKDVVFERVKNRLDSAYDARVTEGYRDVAVNLRVVNKLTLAHGLETHVCEVLLILRPFAELLVRTASYFST